mmetsp:Transcript_31648/g.53962  ORF Transcript_31648/g.53962 Transcript_31648/m.53962 type:complete len:134 (+) Transcript_31648:310-711(+)
MHATSLAFMAKNPTHVVKEVISVAVIALGNDMIATSVVEARVMMARVLFHLSAITKTSSAPKENTINIPPKFMTGKLFSPNRNLYNDQEIGRAKMICSKPNNVRKRLLVCQKNKDPATTHATEVNATSVLTAR